MISARLLPPDCRGEIVQIEHRGMKYNLIFSKKGSLRSGDYHPRTQYDYIIFGEVRVSFPDRSIVLYTGERIAIPREEPHLFQFLEDTWMLERWGGLFKAKYYKPFRKLVDAYMKKQRKKGGRK